MNKFNDRIREYEQHMSQFNEYEQAMARRLRRGSLWRIASQQDFNPTSIWFGKAWAEICPGDIFMIISRGRPYYKHNINDPTFGKIAYVTLSILLHNEKVIRRDISLLGFFEHFERADLCQT